MALDTRIPLMTKGIDGVSVYKDGLELADTWLKRQTNAELDKIKTQTLDIADPNARFDTMVNLAKQSKRAKWLIDELNAEKSAGEQAQLQNQKSLADINKTISEQSKNNAQASKFMTETGKMRIDMSRPIYEILAMTGSTQIANNYLNRLLQIGQMDENEYRSFQDEFKSWSDSGLTPDEIKALGMSYAKSMLSPEYLHQTANNQADNNRAIENSIRDNLTQRITNADDNQTELEKAKLNAQVDMYAQDVKREENQQQAIINARRLAFQKQQAEFQKNKPVGFMVDEQGFKVAILPDGSGVQVLGQDGNPIKEMVRSNTTTKNSPEAETKRIRELKLATDEAKDLIAKSTGSWIGNAYDTVANGFGFSTEGSKAIRQLQVISGRLISAQPRMEGPQSDADVKLYRQMAGDIANPNIPIEDRLAALSTIEQLNEKYANLNGIALGNQKHGRVNPNSAFF